MQFAIDEPVSITADHSGGKWLSPIENWLEFEQERLPLLIPVALGLGISIWQVFGGGTGVVGRQRLRWSSIARTVDWPVVAALKGLMLMPLRFWSGWATAITFEIMACTALHRWKALGSAAIHGTCRKHRGCVGARHCPLPNICRDSIRNCRRIIRVNIDKSLLQPVTLPGKRDRIERRG
jgi:hypothetical protein